MERHAIVGDQLNHHVIVIMNGTLYGALDRIKWSTILLLNIPLSLFIVNDPIRAYKHSMRSSSGGTWGSSHQKMPFLGERNGNVCAAINILCFSHFLGGNIAPFAPSIPL